MKPEQFIKTVQMVCWSCNREEHNHPTEAGAAACVARKPNPPKPKGNNWTESRVQEVVSKKEAGMSYKDIGAEYGVGASRIQQIVSRWHFHKEFRECQERRKKQV